ncbi:MAG: hypothetical protein CR984_01970 [Proteobacteria bacterium]|nr:MAG: hypothetical protein CR984_01970 [Pseudomonadota bacterium]
MIINLKKFIDREQPYWHELDELLCAREADPHRSMDLAMIKRLHFLYQRASADLGKISTFAAEPGVRAYLETLVGRAYAAIHSTRKRAVRITPLKWAAYTLPRTFRRRWKLFGVALAVILAGFLFGAAALVLDPSAKTVLMPFDHLQADPSDRVAREERPAETDHLQGAKGGFSAFLMTHNTRISILVLALGMTWGIGTVILLFSNGVMLGAVAADYIRAGESLFLSGWLLPHGVIEIPALIIAGQAGLLLATALIDRSSGLPLDRRMEVVTGDVVTLIGGVALMLVWAGIIEAFFSQYHAPVIPYALKICFGIIELAALIAFLGLAGRGTYRPLNLRYPFTFLKRRWR